MLLFFMQPKGKINITISLPTLFKRSISLTFPIQKKYDYETNYFQIAEHFNGLRELSVVLYQIAGNFTAFCASELKIEPTSADFSDEFLQIVTESRK